MSASGGRYLHFQVSRFLILWLEVSVVSGTIPIPQNDVIFCQAEERQGDFRSKRTAARANKSASAYFLGWVRVISSFRGKLDYW